jgi:hypothetical protein
MLSWIIEKTENVVGCIAFCGSVDDADFSAADHAAAVPFSKMGSRFVKNVWSELELETAASGSSMGSSSSIVSLEVDADDDDDTVQSRQDSLVSCQEPQETGSNMPVLRQLPSFGSNLASNSLESEIYRSSTGMSSYPTLEPSTDSATRRRFIIPPMFGNTDEEYLEAHTTNKGATASASLSRAKNDSFIFLRQ